MGLFSFWKNKASSRVDLVSCVKKTLDKKGFPYENNGNMFALLFSGKNADYKTGLTCDGNKLVAYAIAPTQVPKHIHIPISLEINRINNDSQDVVIILNDNGDTATLGAISDRTFISKPTDEELLTVIISPMNVLDSRFSSLMCAMLGVATDEELKQRMLSAIAPENLKEGPVSFQITDPYKDALNQSGDISSPRFCGRLLALARHIIENRISKTAADKLLTGQAEFNYIIQTAYNAGDAEECSLIRKLVFIVNAKRTPEDDNAEEFIGRMEGMSIAENNIQDLLKE